jgi:hypothetical protein
VDGFPWPCPTARRALVEVFAADRVGLQRHMLQLVTVAEGEIGGRTPAELYHRFVAWALGPGERCRVCSSSRHAAIAGVPPRLVPCNKVHFPVGAGTNMVDGKPVGPVG